MLTKNQEMAQCGRQSLSTLDMTLVNEDTYSILVGDFTRVMLLSLNDGLPSIYGSQMSPLWQSRSKAQEMARYWSKILETM